MERSQLERYLRTIEQAPVQVVDVQPIGELVQPGEDVEHNGRERGSIKTFGYGKPLRIRYCTGSEERQVVLHTASASPFGYEYEADRAAAAIRTYSDFATLPHHVPTLDVGLVTQQGEMRSTAGADEYFWLTRYAPGYPYAEDLVRLRDGADLRTIDVQRAAQLATYLADIHRHKRNEPTLYRRHLRDLFGSGEGIAGLMDSYPTTLARATPRWLEAVETSCVQWHWQLRRSGRLAVQIHGDFHPFNILVEERIKRQRVENGHGAGATIFHLLDRSRSPWGEAADDVSCLAINYLFFSLQRSGTLAPPFTDLWQTFWRTYLHESKDYQLLTVVQPFLVWRALVLSSPLWYDVTETVRRTLYDFIDAVLHERYFEPRQISTYLGHEICNPT